MANEITIVASVRISKGNFLWEFNPGQKQADLTTARRGGNVQTIGTGAPEALTDGDVSTPRLAILRNTDSTNYVTVGPQSSTTSNMEPMLRIPAGHYVMLWLDPAVVLMALANTASVDLQVDIFDT